ncbi:amino acid transporter [Aspergillus sclerotioniger CBS 115572]|uniref:Amino acid transporter n=1 Tax=Aspergillus sclerotioniger CBS 115572 TaxID=1450535 RepID=A0A317WUU7_9EURO|nr:amino acid transporter [Aspergillus sclerotioniger CBS 115572]PWY88030.1 amino acid transporter [Aspergillus sclerotioniger CBS 115572]
MPESVEMTTTKGGNNISTTFSGDDGLTKGPVSQKYIGTMADQRDMQALGKEQVLRRNFRFISIVAFGCTLIASWEVVLTMMSSPLVDGGTAGFIWGFLVVSVGVLLLFASLAEMASMAPTAGGQYHWVSEFAPKSCQKFLSYITGWLCATGWECAIVSIAFLAGTIIQGLAILNYPDYVFKQWHGTLITIAITLFSVLFNTFLAKKLPLVEAFILILHVAGFFIVIIPLWVLAPISDAKTVFTQFTNGGGWNSDGTATMVGLITALTAMIGYDCTVHMSEEVRDASTTIPKAIMAACTLNGILAFVVMVTLCFTLGNVDTVLNSKTGYPFIQVFFDATKSYAATNAMTAIVTMSLIASVITEVATASRQLWSFARDGGVPLASFFGQVNPNWNIPLNAVIVSLVLTILLSLINIGSTVALDALITLTVGALLNSYIVTVSCVALKRIRGEPLPPHRWSLGRWGLWVNLGALAFLIPEFIFVMFPLYSTVDPTTMNWSSLMYGGMLIFSILYYVLYGHKTYVPPVALVQREM